MSAAAETELPPAADPPAVVPADESVVVELAAEGLREAGGAVAATLSRGEPVDTVDPVEDGEDAVDAAAHAALDVPAHAAPRRAAIESSTSDEDSDEERKRNAASDAALRVPVLVPRKKILRTAAFLNRILPFATRTATQAVRFSLTCSAWRGFFVEGQIPEQRWDAADDDRQQREGSREDRETVDAAASSSSDDDDDDAFVFLFDDDAVTGADPIWRHLVNDSLQLCSNALVDFTLLNATWGVSHMARISDEMLNEAAAIGKKRRKTNIGEPAVGTASAKRVARPFFYRFAQQGGGIRRGGASLKALNTAVELERTEIARVLIDHDAVDVLALRGAVLVRAAEIGNVEMLRVLLRAPASAAAATTEEAAASSPPSIVGSINNLSWFSQTALVCAARRANLAAVKFLLEHGARVGLRRSVVKQQQPPASTAADAELSPAQEPNDVAAAPPPVPARLLNEQNALEIAAPFARRCGGIIELLRKALELEQPTPATSSFADDDVDVDARAAATGENAGSDQPGEPVHDEHDEEEAPPPPPDEDDEQ